LRFLLLHAGRRGLCALLLSLLAAAGLGPAAAQDNPPDLSRHLVVGTAPVAGHYYPTGGALCRLINAHRDEDGLRCLVEATAGATENLTRLRAGDLAFALVPSDWQYHAYRSGLGTGDDEPFTGLRAVLSLQALSFTVLAAPASGIESLADLEGKRVNLGPPDTPWRSTGDFLIPASHPSGPVAEATGRCGARLLEVDGAAVERLLGEWDFYAPAVIPGGLYPNNPDPVTSFGLRATLVTSEDLPADTVYRVTKRIFEGLDELRAQHAVFAGLAAENMAAAASSAPLHQGALRYYQERGWR
jgi:TRAP-type uncharacterized transport system substrate-binding protein